MDHGAGMRRAWSLRGHPDADGLDLGIDSVAEAAMILGYTVCTKMQIATTRFSILICVHVCGKQGRIYIFIH